MATPLKKPQLYRPAEGHDAKAGSPACLNAVKCACGHVAFPPQHYGCERCGRSGSDLQEEVLSGQGRLLASSTVHMHAAAYPVAPFTVVEVELDHGVVTRGLLAENPPSDLKPGIRVHSILQAEPAEGGDVLDLRFAVIAN